MIKKSTLLVIISIISISMYGCSNKQVTAEKQSTAKNQATAKTKATTKTQATAKTQTTTKTQATTSLNNVKNSTESKSKTAVKETFYGEWVVKANPISGSVTAYSNEDIKNIVGQKLYYLEGQASYKNNICTSPVYNKSSISKTDFETNNRVNLSKLNIASFPIEKVVVNGLSGTGNIFYVKDANKLLLFDGGVYFELSRVN